MERHLTADPPTSALHFNNILLSAYGQVFPRRPSAPQPKAWKHAAVQASVPFLWELRNERKPTLRLPRLGQLLLAWKKVLQMQRIAHNLKTRGIQARKALLHEQLQLAKNAAESRDQHGLYLVVRRLAPKSTRQVVCIRDTNGGMLNAAQEFNKIRLYFCELFQTSNPNYEYVFEHSLAFRDVLEALRSTRIGKTVPVGSATASAFRACEGQILPQVTTLMNECYQGRSPIPQHWLLCHLALLPKPHKSTRRPEHLRSMSIQDPVKIYSRGLKSTLFEEVKDKILLFPQVFYLAGRSTEDAIHRVLEHCRAVRRIHEQAARTVYSKQAGIKLQSIGGGAQRTLDMSTAFDRVPRSSLTEALRWAGASAQTMQLHEQCRYVIRHGAHVSFLSMKRGVKQGCTLAPLLCVMYSLHVAHHIGMATNYDWMLSNLMMLASGLHC